MLKRVIVASKDKAFVEAVEQAAAKHSMEANPIDRSGTVAPGTVAVVADESKLSAALNVALSLGKEQEAILRLLADALACREDMPLGSSERVRQHAERFAKALNLSADDQLTLERAALLRDIGKIKIPNDILLKKSVLSYDEWMLMQQHTHLGADLLEERGICTDVVDAVRFHHECYDGDGYPDHLERDAIPYMARIMKILDVYCAMTSKRHYRKTRATHEQAAEYLKSERGKHYDPELIDVFLNAEVGQTGQEE